MLTNTERSTSAPLLIIAQSARFLIQAAARHGHHVRAADCFADTDSLAACQHFLKLPAIETVTPQLFSQIIEQLSAGESATLIIGTGLEHLYPALNYLPAHINYAGNAAEVCELVCLPRPWFSLLDKLQLAYPPVSFDQQTDDGWLSKNAAAWGGSHIKSARAGSHPSRYLQRHITGNSFSALFVIDDRQQASVLMFNQQSCLDPVNGDFRLQMLSNQAELPPHHQQAVTKAIEAIQQQLQLRGLNSLDFMISDTNDLLLLELNPRPSASCQLLPDSLDWLSWQIQPPSNLTDIKLSYRLLYHFFADTSLSVPEAIDWPADFCDLPAPDSLLAEGDPVCSVCIEAADRPQLMTALDEWREFFRNKLMPRLKNRG